MTKFCSERIAKYAFEYAYLNNRKKVTAVHKANIMKLADGLFLESCRQVATKYAGIKYNEIIVDNCCMQLVSKPEQFDVMVSSIVSLIHTMLFSFFFGQGQQRPLHSALKLQCVFRSLPIFTAILWRIRQLALPEALVSCLEVM